LTTGRSPRWKPILVAFAAALVVAGLGGAATDIGPWYQALQKPSWQPPDWLFGPAWTLIYGLTALSAVEAWVRAPQGWARTRIVFFFAFNALLNVLWSQLFFGFRRPDWALVEVGVLWASILVLMMVVRPYSTRAVWLLVPYLLWVSFAAFLNFTVVRLNAPFGG
jgi:tryptophan-rich sensory protein